MNYFLFNIPGPWSWTTAQVANIISIISAAATVYAIWYAYARNRKQDNKINDLTIIAQELSEQNTITKLQLKDAAAPKFVIKGASIMDRFLTLTLHNEGNKATIGRSVVNFNEVIFDSYSGSIVLRNEELVFYGKPGSQKPLKDSRNYLIFEYFDIYKNPYTMGITGHGDIVTSWTYKEGLKVEVCQPG
jgi:hypothetical protein